MTEKLRSHLKSEKGFTLIELLVVIAIIAILVVIVIVAINPLERLNEANDRRAAANVRAGGTLIATCVTRNSGLVPCETSGQVEAVAGGDGKLPTTATFQTAGAAGSTTNICLYELGRTGRYYVYRQSTGQVTFQAAAPVACV